MELHSVIIFRFLFNLFFSSVKLNCLAKVSLQLCVLKLLVFFFFSHGIDNTLFLNTVRSKRNLESDLHKIIKCVHPFIQNFLK